MFAKYIYVLLIGGNYKNCHLNIMLIPRNYKMLNFTFL